MADLIFPGELASAVLGPDSLPENVDMAIWQGDKQDFTVILTDGNGNAVNLTGTTAEAVIKSTFASALEYHFTCTVYDINKVRVYMPTSVSATLAPGDYIWNFQIIDGVGDAHTYLTGDVKVYAEVS